MRGVYTANQRIVGLNAAKTILYITAPANVAVEILSLSVTNDSNATNEQERISLKRISVLGTPTGTAVTPTPHEAGDQAAGSVINTNITASEPTYGAIVIQEGFSSLGGYYFDPVPEERPVLKGSASLGVFFESTPTSFNCDVRFTFREIG